MYILEVLSYQSHSWFVKYRTEVAMDLSQTPTRPCMIKLVLSASVRLEITKGVPDEALCNPKDQSNRAHERSG